MCYTRVHTAGIWWHEPPTTQKLSVGGKRWQAVKTQKTRMRPQTHSRAPAYSSTLPRRPHTPRLSSHHLIKQSQSQQMASHQAITQVSQHASPSHKHPDQQTGQQPLTTHKEIAPKSSKANISQGQSQTPGYIRHKRLSTPPLCLNKQDTCQIIWYRPCHRQWASPANQNLQSLNHQYRSTPTGSKRHKTRAPQWNVLSNC